MAKTIRKLSIDYLIIGDVLSKTIPSLEIRNWLIKYWEISKKHTINVKAISGFYVVLNDNTVEPFWVEFLQDNVDAEIIFPPILRLKVNITGLALEDGALELIKSYSNDFIEFLLRIKKKRIKRNASF